MTSSTIRAYRRRAGHALRPLLLACAVALPAAAQTLTIGNGAPATSIDPHFHTATPNLEISKQIFDGLTYADAEGQLHPALAESWRMTGPETWELRLRQGVRFHNGAPFTAEDVAFTLGRVPNVPNSPASFGIFTRSIIRAEVVDAHTVRLHTSGTDPLLPVNLSWVMILNRATHDGVTTEQFNDGSRAVGTGPYRLASFMPGDRIELERNDAYWGTAPAWRQVSNRVIRNNAARTAALLAGDVDIINGVAPADIARLRADPRFVLREAAGLRIVYLGLDSSRDASPFVSGPNGEALPRNPLRDARVRRALALALDRRAIAERIMEGAAVPTAQVVWEGLNGHVPGLEPVSDPARARALLAEAGFGDGFRITLHGPNDRYPNDARVIQAVGQMWQRIGVRTTVEPQPWASYSGRLSRQGYSAWLLGGTAATNEASYPLRSFVASFDAATGMGGSNHGRYSNPEFDALLAEALRTGDDAARGALLQRAVRVAVDDQAVIPLYIQKGNWAMRRGIDYAPRADEATHAAEIRSAP